VAGPAGPGLIIWHPDGGADQVKLRYKDLLDHLPQKRLLPVTSGSPERFRQVAETIEQDVYRGRLLIPHLSGSLEQVSKHFGELIRYCRDGSGSPWIDRFLGLVARHDLAALRLLIQWTLAGSPATITTRSMVTASPTGIQWSLPGSPATITAGGAVEQSRLSLPARTEMLRSISLLGLPPGPQGLLDRIRAGDADPALLRELDESICSLLRQAVGVPDHPSD
jgi:hypothetical protein